MQNANNETTRHPLTECLLASTGSAEVEPDDVDALVGSLQVHRPDGGVLVPAIRSSSFEGSDVIADRLSSMYDAAGDGMRPTGGRDAYLLVRRPPPIAPDDAEASGRRWLTALAEIASESDDATARRVFESPPSIRILEGIAPKNPKLDSDRTRLHSVLVRVIPELTADWIDHRVGPMTRAAVYYAACDSMLRDYLLWPTLGRDDDPMSPYFELWRHGVKFRSYREGHLDLYLPHVTS